MEYVVDRQDYKVKLEVVRYFKKNLNLVIFFKIKCVIVNGEPIEKFELVILNDFIYKYANLVNVIKNDEVYIANFLMSTKPELTSEVMEKIVDSIFETERKLVTEDATYVIYEDRLKVYDLFV